MEHKHKRKSFDKHAILLSHFFLTHKDYLNDYVYGEFAAMLLMKRSLAVVKEWLTHGATPVTSRSSDKELASTF